MNDPELSIIIVSYNAADFLIKCIRSVYRYVSSLSYEIIVVDNASKDGSLEKVEAEFPETVRIRNSENLGYARAINCGFENAQGEFCAVMNQDTELKSDVFTPLTALFGGDPRIGAAGCRQISSDGTPRRSYFAFPSLKGRIAYYSGLTRILNRETLHRFERSGAAVSVEVIGGAFMLFRSSVIRLLNGFDPDYFLYQEEADVCKRLRKLSLRSIIVNDLQIIHHGDHRETPDNPFVFYHRNRSILIYFYKHRSFISQISLIKGNMLVFSLLYIMTFFPFKSKAVRRKRRDSYKRVLGYTIRFTAFLFSKTETRIPD
ncbi:glycosyltransferase family 2 protein [candidate division KSB1 bacterium]